MYSRNQFINSDDTVHKEGNTHAESSEHQSGASGPGGKVDAEVLVNRILISGEFRGVIRASERVEILKDGKVFGDIYTPCLIIEAGAIFEGRCNMSDKKAFMREEGASLKAVDTDSNKPVQMAAKP